MLRAGVVTGEAVAKLRANGMIRDPVGAGVAEAVSMGRPLSAGLGRFPDQVPAEDVAFLEAGEATGHLDDNLDRLVHVYDTRRDARRRMLTQALYPLILVHIAAFLLPIGQLAMAKELTPVTWLASALKVLAPFWGLWFLVRWLSRSAVWRVRFRRILDLVPGFGAAARHRRRALFATVLEAAYQGGVPVDRSLDMAARAAGEPGAAAAAVAVAGGSPLATALVGTDVLDPQAVNRLATSEAAGEISQALHRIAAEETAAADALLKRSVTAAGTVIYLLVVAWIAWSVIAFYMGYFERVLGGG
ncbi:MAG: type II secretion system F family protein [Planctomycetota bacterium]